MNGGLSAALTVALTKSKSTEPSSPMTKEEEDRMFQMLHEHFYQTRSTYRRRIDKQRKMEIKNKRKNGGN